MSIRRRAGVVLLAAMGLVACERDLDPMSPGSMSGEYALGIKALVPLVVGNTWNYNTLLYDTLGAVRTRYAFTLSVLDTVSADTSLIPVVPPDSNRTGLTRRVLLWYLLRGESGMTSCWKIDSLENLRIRSSDDTRFYEQFAFDFRATPGQSNAPAYIGPDTVTWASGDRFIYGPDSVRSTLVDRGADSLRTTLGSAPYFHYRQSYATRTDYTDFYFKPGFGLVLREIFQRTPGGTMVRVRRDELASYSFR